MKMVDRLKEVKIVYLDENGVRCEKNESSKVRITFFASGDIENFDYNIEFDPRGNPIIIDHTMKVLIDRLSI